MRRLTAAFALAVTVALLLVTAPTARADPTHPAPTHPPATHSAATAPPPHLMQHRVERVRAAVYWTPARMRQAAPRTAHVNRSGRAHSTPAGAPRLMRGTQYSVSTLGGQWTGGGAFIRSTGKVFFTENGRNYACSGSVVPAHNRSTVITAGHCVKHGAGAFVTNFVFVPGYRDGQAPYGVWTAARLVTTYGWGRQSDVSYDVGFAVVAPHHGIRLEQVTGSQSIGFNQPRQQTVYAFGYSAETPYNGSRLDYCAGHTRPDTLGGTSDSGIACGLTGGSSGGPWFANFQTEPGTGVQISLNSFGYSNHPDVMYGPYFGTAVEATYEWAQNS